jgi:hypothetical protein
MCNRDLHWHGCFWRPKTLPGFRIPVMVPPGLVSCSGYLLHFSIIITLVF